MTEIQTETQAGEDFASLPETPLTQEEVNSFQDTFKEKVDELTAIIQSDPEKYYRCVAEIHVLLMMFESSMRGMMMNGGPKSIIKMLMGRH